MGVFATRSPFRPNPIGLSCVRLEGIRREPELGCVLEVSGADLMDGTPILDIKPYIPYADCRPEASGGFTGNSGGATLAVDFPAALLERVPADKRAALTGVLSRDPRPPTSTIRSGYTAWTSPGSTSASPWTGTPSPSGRWSAWRTNRTNR